MGERDPGLTPPPPPPPRRQRAALALALAALLVAVVVAGPVGEGAAAGDDGLRTTAGEPAATDRQSRAPTRGPALATVALESAAAALAGTRGGPLLGVLALALAAAFACRALERRVGASAPLVVALLVFASGAWALVWSDGAGLVPLALAVVAFSLAYGGAEPAEAEDLYRPPEASWRALLRWLAVGLLLAELVPSGLQLAGLLLPAALAVPRERRRTLMPALVMGFGGGLAAELAVQGPRLLTGPIALAAETLTLDPALIGHSLLALVAGRNVGLLAGFAPLVLLLAAGRGAAGRPALLATGLALPVASALLLPFDFAGGWLSLSFLPLYGALWHLPWRPPRRWEWLAVALLGGLACWPLWLSPGAALAGNGAGLAAAWPRRALPYEMTLRELPGRGEADLAGQGVRARAVGGCRLRGAKGRFEAGDVERGRLGMGGPRPATIWLAVPAGLARVGLELGPGAPSSFAVDGATAGRTVFRPDGRVGFEVLLDQPRGPYRLWVGERPVDLHLIEVRFADASDGRALRFRLLAAPQP